MKEIGMVKFLDQVLSLWQAIPDIPKDVYQ